MTSRLAGYGIRCREEKQYRLVLGGGVNELAVSSGHPPPNPGGPCRLGCARELLIHAIRSYRLFLIGREQYSTDPRLILFVSG